MRRFSIRGFVVVLVALFSLPMSCSIDDDFNDNDCEFSIGKVLTENMELEMLSGIIAEGQFSPYRLEKRLSSYQDSTIFYLKTTPDLYGNAENKASLEWGNQLMACPPSYNVHHSNLNSISIYCSDTIFTSSKIFLPQLPINEILKGWYINRFVDLNELKRLSERNEGIYADRPAFGGDYYFAFNETIQSLDSATFTFNLLVDGNKNFRLETTPLTIR